MGGSWRDSFDVLLLEDDDEWAGIVEQVAHQQGWRLTRVSESADFLAHLGDQTRSCDLVIADRRIAAENIDAIDMIRALRRQGNRLPVLILSLLDSTRQKVEGLDAGADDYLTKPFAADELAARCRTLMRRNWRGTVQLAGAPVEINISDCVWNGRRVAMAPKELALFTALSEAGGDPMSRAELWRRVWPEYQGLLPQDSVIEALVYRVKKILRENLGIESIAAVRGRGYRLIVDAET